MSFDVGSGFHALGDVLHALSIHVRYDFSIKIGLCRCRGSFVRFMLIQTEVLTRFDT